MKRLSSYGLVLIVGLVLLAAIAPALIALSHSLLPLVVVLTVAVAVLRLVFFHTRRW